MLGLIPFVGAGTFTDPFRPDAWDGAGYLDLRPPGQVSGVTLVEQPTIAATRRLATSLDEVLSNTARTRLTAIEYTPPVGATLREAIVDLLIAPPATLPIRPILPTVQSRYEIRLRGVSIFSLPVVSGGTTLTESFNKADAPTLGPDQTWTEFENSGWEVFSNAARIPSPTGSDQAARVDADLASANHYCQANVTTLAGGSNTRYVLTVTRKDGTGTLTYYLGGRISIAGALTHWALYRRVAGTFTQLAILNEAEPAVPYTIKTEINGSTLRLLVGGVEKLSVTDTNIPGNLRCGIHGYRDVGGSITLDAWEAADLAAAATSPYYFRKMIQG